MVKAGVNGVFVKALRPPNSEAAERRKRNAEGVKVETQLAFRFDVNVTDIDEAFENSGNQTSEIASEESISILI